MIWKYGNYIYLVVVLCWLWPFNVFLWVVSVGFGWGFFGCCFCFFFLPIKPSSVFSKFFNLQSWFLWSRVWPKLDCKGYSCTSCKETTCGPKPHLTWDHEISLYPTPSWTAIFTLKLIKAIYFTGFPALKETACFACMVCHCWNCERSWTFPRVPLWILPALPATMRLAVPSWEGCGARACKPLWGRGSWHHRICGSGAGCQATRAPFFFWKKTRFLNTKMLH